MQQALLGGPLLGQSASLQGGSHREMCCMASHEDTHDHQGSPCSLMLRCCKVYMRLQHAGHWTLTSSQPTVETLQTGWTPCWTLKGKRWAKLSRESGCTCNDVLAGLLDGADHHRVTFGQPLQPCRPAAALVSSTPAALRPSLAPAVGRARADCGCLTAGLAM